MDTFGYNYGYEYIKNQLPDSLQHLRYNSYFPAKPTFETCKNHFWEKHYKTLLKEQTKKITHNINPFPINTFFKEMLFSSEYINALNADILIQIMSYYKYTNSTEISIKDFMSVSYDHKKLNEERTLVANITKLITWLRSNYTDYYSNTSPNLHTYHNLLCWILSPCIKYNKQTQEISIKKKKSINNFETYTTSVLLDIMFKYQSTYNIEKYPKFDLKLITKYLISDTKNIFTNFQYLSIIDKANFTYTMECCTLNSYYTELISIYKNHYSNFFTLHPPDEHITNCSPIVPLNTNGYNNNSLQNNTDIKPLSFFTDCLFIDGLQQRNMFYTTMKKESINNLNYSRKDFLSLSTYIHEELYPYISNVYFCYLKNSMGEKELENSIVSYITKNPKIFSQYLENSPYSKNNSEKIKIENFNKIFPDKTERDYLTDMIRNTFELYTQPHITDKLINQTILNGTNIIPPILFTHK